MWLESGKQYTFKTYVDTQSSEANMFDEIESQVSATCFDKFPSISNLTLNAEDSTMSIGWSKLNDFDMPIKNLKCVKLKNDCVL